MSGTVATVCRSCLAGIAGQADIARQEGLADQLRAAFTRARIDIVTRQVDCMSGCTRPATIAFRAPAKTAYLFGDITGADIPDLLIFAGLYLASPDGNLADARPLGGLREKAIARIPG